MLLSHLYGFLLNGDYFELGTFAVLLYSLLDMIITIYELHRSRRLKNIKMTFLLIQDFTLPFRDNQQKQMILSTAFIENGKLSCHLAAGL